MTAIHGGIAIGCAKMVRLERRFHLASSLPAGFEADCETDNVFSEACRPDTCRDLYIVLRTQLLESLFAATQHEQRPQECELENDAKTVQRTLWPYIKGLPGTFER